MGSAKRKVPKELGKKLRLLRVSFEYSFADMAKALSYEEIQVLRTDVQKFETSQREPASLILLRYAKLVGIHVDYLIDDKIELGFYPNGSGYQYTDEHGNQHYYHKTNDPGTV